MKKNTLVLIDFDRVDTLLEGFNKSTGFVTAILDLDGNVLSKSGWRQMCTEFHRINPATSERCTTSDTELANKMAEGKKYHFYKCLNGLIDVAVPIIIDGEHVANLFSGQFFFEEPDIPFFKEQAKKYGFDENKYLDALSKVPIVSQEKVKTAMDFLLNMTQMISDMAFQKLEQIELNNTIKKNEEKFKAVFESASVGKSITLPTGEINVNQAFCDMLGYTREELQNKKWQDITPQDEISAVQKILNHLLNGEKDSARFEKRYICKDGSYKWADVSVSLLRDENDKPIHFITTVIDITERKQSDQQIIEAKEKAEKNEIELIKAQGIAHLGSWYLDVKTDQVVWTEELYKVFGFDHTIPPPPYTEHMKLFTPESWEILSTSLAKTRETGIPYELELKTIRKDNSNGWMWVRGEAVLDTDKKIIGLWGAAQDITERKLANEEIKKQLDELQRWHQVTLGREGRILELKKEVNDLLHQRGEPLRYGSTIPENTAGETKV